MHDIDRFADMVEKSIDMKKIYQLLNLYSTVGHE